MSYSNIDKPSKYFNTVLYTGNGSSPRSITGVGFKPDLVWSKQRSVAENHNLYDAVRGGANSLRTNLTNAENASSIYGYVSTFDSDGVTYISGGTNNDLNNANGTTFVNWNWLGANTTASNNSGTITSTVSANTTSGFSIVSYTGNGSSGATVGHGLGVAPKVVIQKRRTGSIANWRFYHGSIHASSGETNTLFLNSTDANGADIDNISGVSSTTFTTRGTGATNPSGDTCIAYCFAEIKGFSKFGSWTGDGATSTDGLFVYMGFKPKFFIWKRTDTAGFNWYMFDTARDTYNLSTKYILANSSNAEASGINIDFVSNGVKFRDYGSIINASGGKYIYMAFAENPFVSSKGIPCTAR